MFYGNGLRVQELRETALIRSYSRKKANYVLYWICRIFYGCLQF